MRSTACCVRGGRGSTMPLADWKRSSSLSSTGWESFSSPLCLCFACWRLSFCHRTLTSGCFLVSGAVGRRWPGARHGGNKQAAGARWSCVEVRDVTPHSFNPFYSPPIYLRLGFCVFQALCKKSLCCPARWGGTKWSLLVFHHYNCLLFIYTIRIRTHVFIPQWGSLHSYSSIYSEYTLKINKIYMQVIYIPKRFISPVVKCYVLEV